jgi:hypothetical protein
MVPKKLGFGFLSDFEFRILVSNWQDLLCNTKLLTALVPFSFKNFISLRLVLLDDFFQQVDVIGEGFVAGRSQRTGRVRPIVLKRFCYRNVTRLLESADVGRQVPVGHTQRIAHLRERQLWRGSQHGHNRQPPFLVDNAIELEEWFGVHVSSLRFSVKYK